MRERMAVIKQEAAAEVDRKWVSPWRTPDVFDLKVKTEVDGSRGVPVVAGPGPACGGQPGRRTSRPAR